MDTRYDAASQKSCEGEIMNLCTGLLSVFLLLGSAFSTDAEARRVDLAQEVYPLLAASEGTNYKISKRISYGTLWGVRPENMDGRLCGSNHHLRTRTIIEETCLKTDSDGACVKRRLCKVDESDCEEPVTKRIYQSLSTEYECITVNQEGETIDREPVL